MWYNIDNERGGQPRATGKAIGKTETETQNKPLTKERKCGTIKVERKPQIESQKGNVEEALFMKKYKSEVCVTIFHDVLDLISQVNGDYVLFIGDDMFVWRNGTICANYDLKRFKSWCINDKRFDVERGIWMVKYFLDI